jgi:CRP/FNR family transcriptional regulator
MVDGSLVERLEAIGSPVTHHGGAVLFDQGQPGEGVYVVKSGTTRLTLLNTEGTPMWSRVARPGAILGLPSTLSRGTYSLRATAVGDVELVFVPTLRLEELIRQDTSVGTALLRVVSEELSDLRRKLSLLKVQIPKR